MRGNFARKFEEEGGMIHGLIRGIKRGLIGSLAVWWSALSLENVRNDGREMSGCQLAE